MTIAFWKLLATPWGRVFDLLLGGLHGALGAALRLRPSAGGPGLELSNKLGAFTGFRRGIRQARSRPGNGPGDRNPRLRGSRRRRSSAVEGTDRVFRELWEREGAGYGLAEQLLRQGRLDLHVPTDRNGPEALPLYTGLGLCLASRLLAERGASPPAVVDRFATALERAVPEAHLPAALENLGFAVRMLCPGRLSAFDAALGDRRPDLPELFWHGAGRGLYFGPGQILSLRPRSGSGAEARWPALERALSGASHTAGRRNAVAGLTWALTLVNLRHPAVVARRLQGLDRRPDRHRDLIPWAVDGLVSAVLFWCATTGDRAIVRRFLDGVERPPDRVCHPGSGVFWSREVAGPVRAALDELLPRLERESRVSELFRAGVDRRWSRSTAPPAVPHGAAAAEHDSR